MRFTTLKQLAGAVLAGLVLCALTATHARAGSYEVLACNAAPGGANNSWETSVNAGTVAAYTACPAGGEGGGGIVTRSAVQQGGNAAPGHRAQATFRAPPGTTITGIHAAYLFNRNTGGDWNVGLSTGSVALEGCYGNRYYDCDVPSPGKYIPVPNAAQLQIETYCVGSFCPLQSTGKAEKNYAQASARLFSARVVLQDDSQPSVTNLGGSLLSGGWKRGVQTVSFDAADNSGIRETQVRMGKGLLQELPPCDFTRPVPCSARGSLFDFDTTSIGGDGVQTLSAVAIDAGGNARSDTRSIAVDNTPPAAPLELTLSGGTDWRSTNRFRLTWRNPDETGVAPIAGAEYELCPPSAGACSRGSRDGAGISAIDDLKVPEPGDYTLRLWLRDEAGNEDRKLAAPPVHLRYDNTPPTLAFAAQDASDPTVVAVEVHDDLSGPAGGTIEGKRPSDEAWRPLDTTLQGNRLVGHLDDETLPDGSYELRARVADRAGNERSTGTLADGRPAVLTLPLRLKTRLSVGKTRRVGKRRRILRRSSLRVRFGSRVRLTGRLSTADGSPFADAEITVYEQQQAAGASFVPIATTKTSKTGRFSYLARRGASRLLRFRYNGTPTIRAARWDLAVAVSARTTIHASRRSLVNGEALRLSGRLRGGAILPQGKLVEIQVFARGHWRTFVTTRTNPGGVWRQEYRFDGTRGKVRYRLRARIPKEAGYPYGTGHSARISVVVRGL
jgi:hypothetical protein